MPPRHGSGPSRLGSILTNVVARLGIDRDLDDYRIWEAWDEVVGPAIARNAQPVRLDARRLVIAVRSNVWMQELSLLREELCQRLNTWMDRDIVGEIFLVVGKIESDRDRRTTPIEPITAPPARFQRATRLRPADQVRTELEAAIERLWQVARHRNR